MVQTNARGIIMKLNTITNSDCLKYLKKLPDNSVDLVLTDPPYNIGFDGGKGWDSYWKSDREYILWCMEWTQECIRVLKDERMLVVWGTLKTEAFLLYKLALNRVEEITEQNEIIWSYNWGGRSKDNFARKHEYAWCYSKGDKFLFNGDDVRVDRKMKTNIRTGGKHTQGTIPTCVWEKNNHTTSKDFVGWHPTTKNLDILSRIIKAYTNKGDVVLDCFMGSGSTAVASLRCGRQFIGCEKDKSYYIRAKKRICDSQNTVTKTQSKATLASIL